MRDLDMKMKPAVLGILIGVAARRDRQGKRNAEHAPTPDNQPKFSFIRHQRHAGIDRPEALAHQPLEMPASLLLR